jgi:hypothetical protein
MSKSYILNILLIQENSYQVAQVLDIAEVYKINLQKDLVFLFLHRELKENRYFQIKTSNYQI